MAKKKLYDIHGKEVQVNDILFYSEEDGEDEASAGVGNASYFSFQGYIKIVEYKGERYAVGCDKNGWYAVDNINFEKLTSIDKDITIKEDIMFMSIVNR